MCELIMSGGPWTPSRRRTEILDYCAEDVYRHDAPPRRDGESTDDASRRMGHAVLRGRYMAAVAAMEHDGIPITFRPWNCSNRDGSNIQYSPYPGNRLRTSASMTGGPLRLPASLPCWPAQGRRGPLSTAASFALDDDTFRQMARAYPAVSPLRELRHRLAKCG